MIAKTSSCRASRRSARTEEGLLAEGWRESEGRSRYGAPEPISGQNTQLRFQLSTAEGLEKYLGAWGHMLAASDDLIDMMHSIRSSPMEAPDSVQHDLPTAETYRVWVQFQRNGVVNTVHF